MDEGMGDTLVAVDATIGIHARTINREDARWSLEHAMAIVLTVALSRQGLASRNTREASRFLLPGVAEARVLIQAGERNAKLVARSEYAGADLGGSKTDTKV